MNHEQKYKDALKRAREYKKHGYMMINVVLDNIFPELKESEDERIRKEIVDFINRVYERQALIITDDERDNWIAWLEKQGEPKAHGTWFNTKDTAAPSERDIIGWYKTDGKLEPCPMTVWFCSEEEAEKEAEENDDCFLAYWAELPEQNFEKNYWLEKQREKPQGKTALEAITEENVDNRNCVKPTDNVEPKFKIGDWIITKENENAKQIVCIEYFANGQPQYVLSNGLWFGNGTEARLWSIEDAKDGNVLSNGEMIVIFKKFEEPSYRQHIIAYIGLDRGGDIQITDDTWSLGIDKAKPATKEQRDLLFSKMKEEGYEWDFDTKELKKAIIEPKFKIGDWFAYEDIDTAKIIDINDDRYKVEFIDSHRGIPYIDFIDRNSHLWTIQDAKDGDVLTVNGNPFIYCSNGDYQGNYCCIDPNGVFRIGLDFGFSGKTILPSTKEQRELLFEKMKEAGYEWDSEKKELKTIEE